MFDIGGGELLFIILMILLLFGPKKIPEIARSLGKGMSQLRKAQAEFQRNVNGLTADIEAGIEPTAGNKDNQPSLFPRAQQPSLQEGKEENPEKGEIQEKSAETDLTKDANPAELSKPVIPQPAAHTIAREKPTFSHPAASESPISENNAEH